MPVAMLGEFLFMRQKVLPLVEPLVSRDDGRMGDFGILVSPFIPFIAMVAPFGRTAFEQRSDPQPV